VALCAYAGLIAVGARSRRRTSALRRGRPPVAGVARSGCRTSPATHLAWVAGAGVAVAGAGLLRSSVAAAGAILVAWGAFVVVTGTWGRVVAVRAGTDALTVAYAARAARRLPWPSVRRLTPPATLLGAWRFEGDGPAIGLMPSDLLGHEGILATAIRRAGLTFDGRAWVRPAVGTPAPDRDGRPAGSPRAVRAGPTPPPPAPPTAAAPGPR